MSGTVIKKQKDNVLVKIVKGPEPKWFPVTRLVYTGKTRRKSKTK